jgi:hypothetical protein
MNVTSLLKNEHGSVMVLALIILVLLTLMGISATTTSTIEVEIAGNERAYKQNFYQSEAAAMVAARQLENTNATLLGDISTISWIKTDTVDPNNLNLTSNIWNPVTGIDNARFTVVENTGLIDLTQPSNLHRYAIYGVYDAGGGGQVVIEIGYKRRF